MSKLINGGRRTKSARETYVEQLPYGRGLTPAMNKKHEIFTSLNPSTDPHFAYRSTSTYLRQLAQEKSLSPTEIMSAWDIPRTKSASELTATRNNSNRSINGNPKYKAQEDYYDEIQILKKDMKTMKEENSNLRAKIRRVEEDNVRKRKEIDELYNTNKDGESQRALTGSMTDRNNKNTSRTTNIMSFKQRLFQLESQLKRKETEIDEIKTDPKWTKSKELEIQNRALLGELERQKVERLNYIQQNDYIASVDEEKKKAVQKLTREKDDLKTENDSLKKKVRELEQSRHSEPLSILPLPEENKNEELLQKTEDLKQMKRELQQVRSQLDKANEDLERIQHDRQKSEQPDENIEEIKRERNECQTKLVKANKDLEKSKHERDEDRRKLEETNENLAEMKRERDQLEKKLEQTNKDLERERTKPTKVDITGGSSVALKRIPVQPDDPTSPRAKRPQSPMLDTRSPASPSTAIRQVSDPFDEPKRSDPKRISSPPLTSNSKNLGSGTIKDRPSSAGTSNESALKTVQASLRGYLTRSDIDKISGQPPSSLRSTSTIEKSEPIDNGTDDYVPTPPKRSLKADVIDKRHDSPSPPLGKRQPSSPTVGNGGSKQNLGGDQNKPDSDGRISRRDQDRSGKAPRSHSPSAASHPISASHIAGNGGSKENLRNDQNKPDSGGRISRPDQDRSGKVLRSPSPSKASHPISPSHIAGNGGSKPNLREPNADDQLSANDKASSSKLQRLSSPNDTRGPKSRDIPPENSRPSSGKKPTNSKQSVRDTQKDDDFDDDDDIVAT